MTDLTAPKITTHNPGPGPGRPTDTALLATDRLSLFYGTVQALKTVSMGIRERVVTSFIGPSGCGKSTLLRCFNRMNDLIDDVHLEGTVRIGGQDINSKEVDVIELRKKVGM